MTSLREHWRVLFCGLSLRIPGAEFEYRGEKYSIVTVGIGPFVVWAVCGAVFGFVIVPLATFEAARFVIESLA